MQAAAAILAGNEVRPAGKRLGQPIVGFEHMSKAEKDELYRVFSVANFWRESHVYPMRSVRQSVIARMRTLGCNGITAGRVKRMAAIRRKLDAYPSRPDTGHRRLQGDPRQHGWRSKAGRIHQRRVSA
jgi:hypothetical protein